MTESVPTVECPAGICQKKAATFDHDRMFGHLLSDHSWSFDTSQEWVVENMADEDEAIELEKKFVTLPEE